MQTFRNLIEPGLLLFAIGWLIVVFAWNAVELRALPGPVALVVGLAAYLLPVYLAVWSYAKWRDHSTAPSKT